MMSKSLGLAVGAAAFVMSAHPSPAQDPAPLTIDNSITCAAIFWTHSQLPENASYAEGVQNYREMTATFMRRAEILSERQGLPTDTVIERIAETSVALIAMVDEAEGPSGRMEVINSWSGAEKECIDGGLRPV
jgi:hypothetical protein